jgi:hypothetical protein
VYAATQDEALAEQLSSEIGLVAEEQDERLVIEPRTSRPRARAGERASVEPVLSVCNRAESLGACSGRATLVVRDHADRDTPEANTHGIALRACSPRSNVRCVRDGWA